MKKFLKIIAIIVILIVLVLLVKIVRNYFIISSLCTKYETSTAVDNYHITQIGYQYSSCIISDMYKNSDKGKLVLNVLSLEDYSNFKTITTFDNDTTTYTYTDEEISKNADSTTQPITIKNPYNLYSSESENNTLVELFNTSIESTTYHGEECYIINNSMATNMYISKDTGLVLRENNGYVIIENEKRIEIEYIYYYEFNTVTESDVTFTDIDTYTEY